MQSTFQCGNTMQVLQSGILPTAENKDTHTK